MLFALLSAKVRINENKTKKNAFYFHTEGLEAQNGLDGGSKRLAF